MTSSIINYLANLKDKGNLCILEEASSTNNSLVSGKIVQSYPLVKRSKFQSQDVLIFHLKELYGFNNRPRATFKVLFVGQAAQLVNILNLCNGDYVTFRNPKLFPDASYMRPYSIYPNQIIVGLPHTDRINDFYYKRKDSDCWNQVVSSPQCEDPIRAKPNICDDNVRRDQTDREIRSSGIISPTSKSNNEPRNTIVNNLYRYVKLAEIEKNSKVNVYGVISRVQKNPTFSKASKKYRLTINIKDESKTDEFFVHIFARSIDDFSHLKPYNIVRLHRLQIEEYVGRIDGRVFNGHDVVVFDKEDTNIIYKNSQNCSLSESDRERVNELKKWMLENISESRPFTTLDKLELKSQTINLSGEIVDVKVYEDHPKVALRIRDGTKCTIPFFRLSFSTESTTDIFKESKVQHSESEEIDIVVSEPDKNFKTLKAGERIELFNVRILVQTEYVKTVPNDHLRFYMKGDWDNLKCTSLKRTHTKFAENTPTKNSHSEESVRKRRLFNPEISSIVFEDDIEMNDLNDENENESSNNARHENDNQNKEENVAESTSAVTEEKDDQNDYLIDNETNVAKITAENQVLTTNKTMDEDSENNRSINKEKNNINNGNEKESTTAETLHVTRNQNDLTRNKEKNVSNDTEDDEVSTSEVQGKEANQNIPIICTKNNDDLTSTSHVLFDKENCGRVSTPCESSVKNEEEFYTKWPKDPPSKPFKVKVHLLTTSPHIDKNSNNDHIISLLYHYCDICKNFYNKDQINWNVKIEDDPIPYCPKCEESEHLKKVLKLEMLVSDNQSGCVSVIIMGKYAEDFFGCTVDDFCLMEEERCKIKNLIDSYLWRIWRPVIPLLLQITPVKLPGNANKLEYHVTGVIRSTTS